MSYFNRVCSLCVLMIIFALAHSARVAAETGGAEPATDNDWPVGSLEVANHPSRAHWSEGLGETEFFGGGDAAALNDVLAKFAKIQAPQFNLMIHAGVTVFDPGPGSGSVADHRVAWSFSVWNPSDLYDLPGRFRYGRSSENRDVDDLVVSAVLNIWPATPGLDWSKVRVPAGLNVTDERATSHGYKPADGTVIAGVAYDMMTSKPVANVEIALEDCVGEKGKPRKWVEVAHAAGGAGGHFEMKNIPTGGFFILLRAPGYATRMIGICGGAPGAGTFTSYTIRLAPAVTQKGVLVGADGWPMANVTITVANVTAIVGSRYWMTADRHPETTTDAAGRFTLANFPMGEIKLDARTPDGQSCHLLRDTVDIPEPTVTLIKVSWPGLRLMEWSR